MLNVDLSAPPQLLHPDIDLALVTDGFSNIDVKKAIAFSALPVARALASAHSSNWIAIFAR
jgi:hypothetical protein